MYEDYDFSSTYQEGVEDAIGWSSEILKLVYKLEEQGIMKIHHVIEMLENKLKEKEE